MRLAIAGLAVLSAVTLVPGTARADVGIASFGTSTTSLVAGGHPDFTTDIAFSVDGQLRDVAVDLPAGVALDATAIPRCTQGQLETFSCPAGAQVGVLRAIIRESPLLPAAPIYIMAPAVGEVVHLAARLSLFVLHVRVTRRATGDQGLRAEMTNIGRSSSIARLTLALWGVPAAASHDGERLVPGPTGLPETPFVTNPTHCDEPLRTTVKARGWGAAGSVEDHFSLPPMTECEALRFEPRLEVSAQPQLADSPAAFEVAVQVPQYDDPGGRAASQLRRMVVTLPEGAALALGGFDGLVACSDALLGLGSEQPEACPEASRIGVAEVHLAGSPVPLRGSMNLRDPAPGEPLRIALAVAGAGLSMKIPAVMRSDPATGQVALVLAVLPQVPLRELRLRFDGGRRALLATPLSCGRFSANAAFTPWSGNSPVSVSSTFGIGIGIGIGFTDCPAALPFAPLLTAGVTNPVAGESSPFILRVTRNDRDQELGSIDVRLPPGVTAALGRVRLCPPRDARVGSCPPESRVGTAALGLGPGPAPLYANGQAFLTDGYAGAPFGLSIALRVVAGPLDLGTVVVRAALTLDRRTARLSLTSATLPRAAAGIPLRLRDLRLALDRPGFVLTPTSCDETAVEATAKSLQGTEIRLSRRFQVAGCRELRHAPRLGVHLLGPRRMAPRGHPGLRVRVHLRSRDANLERVGLRLPSGLRFDHQPVRRYCTPDRLRTLTCPSVSRVGSSRLVTPLSSTPLSGSLHLAGTPARPRLAVLLGGAVDLEFAGVLRRSRRARISLLALPDLPLDLLELRFSGGPSGLFVSRDDLCDGVRLARTSLRSHDGRRASSRVRVRTRCGVKHRPTFERRRHGQSSR